MSLRFLLSLVVVALAVQGCDDDGFVSPIYDTCFDINDCVPAAQICEELSVDFAGQFYTNAICTVFCAIEGEGPVSPDCPRAFVGRNGSCYPSEIAGGPNADLVCFEPCDANGDCLLGFRCLGAEDLCPDDPGCPIIDGDRICVPGPR